MNRMVYPGPYVLGVVRLDRSYSAPSQLEQKNWASIQRYKNFDLLSNYNEKKHTTKKQNLNFPPGARAPHGRRSEQLKFDSLGRCTNAFKVITSTETLRIAYETIQPPP